MPHKGGDIRHDVTRRLKDLSRLRICLREREYLRDHYSIRRGRCSLLQTAIIWMGIMKLRDEILRNARFVASTRPARKSSDNL